MIKKYKKENGCTHPTNFCVCATKAIQHIVRSYKIVCIFQPYRLESGKFAITNESDKLTLCRIGFYFGALMCAELTKQMPKLHLDKYQDGYIKYNSLICKTISGRQLRFNNVINPLRHQVYFLQSNSPLVKMAVAEAHKRIGCGLGVGAYIKNMLVMGVSAPNLPAIIHHYIKACQGCLHYNLFFSAKTPFSRALKESSGPNNSLDACLNSNPLSFLIVDELGPVFL